MQNKKTLRQLHAELKELPVQRREMVLMAVGSNTETSTNVFYEILNGRRRNSPAEKEAIAKVYGMTAAEIDWQDEKILPE